MKKKIGSIILFVCCFTALIISLKIFYNMGVAADEFSTSPAAFSGGDFWLTMDWLRLALLAGATFISGYKVLEE